MKITAGVILVIIVVGALALYYGPSVDEKMIESQSSDSAYQSTVDQNDTSDAALESDLTSIESQLNKLDLEASAAASSINQEPASF